MEIINLKNKKEERLGYLRILLEYGYELTLCDSIQVLLDLREDILWKWDMGEVFYHIQLKHFDNYIKTDKIVSMEIMEEVREDNG